MNLHIDIASDIVCPWCYIGKRHLEAALELFTDQFPTAAAPTLGYLPFQLNPDLPDAGMDRQAYLEQKFGNAAPDVYARVQTAGDAVDIAFAFDHIASQPNTTRAHALVDLAANYGLQPRVKEAMMQAYFCEGADLTDNVVLASIATHCGMPLQAVVDRLQDGAALERVKAQDAQLRELGITGVPFFIINRKIVVSGAQPPEQLLAAMLQALE